MNTTQIKKILKDTYPYLDEKDINQLLDISTYKKLSKKEILIKAGQISDEVFFILQGMIRGYFINDSGEEKNIFLRVEHTVSGAPEPVFFGIPTRYTFESVLESHLLTFKFKPLKKLAMENQAFFEFYTEVFQENLTTLINRVEGLINNTPEERYEKLIKQNPQFFQKALSKHVANYLGITPNSLSRIIRRKSKS